MGVLAHLSERPLSAWVLKLGSLWVKDTRVVVETLHRHCFGDLGLRDNRAKMLRRSINY